MVVQIENAQNGFIVRTQDGADPVVVADFGQCINVLMQAFNIQLQNAEGEEASEEAGESSDTEETAEVEAEEA